MLISLLPGSSSGAYQSQCFVFNAVLLVDQLAEGAQGMLIEAVC